jgi:formylglycine-generating enzyme required for sulfatase activity
MKNLPLEWSADFSPPESAQPSNGRTSSFAKATADRKVRAPSILCLLALLLTTVPASAESGTPATLRDAIAHLTKTFPASYPRGPEFLQRLAALGENPDPAALATLRREALLANPLLDFDRILLIERETRVPGLPQNWQGNCQLPRGDVSNRIAILHNLRGLPGLETLHAPSNKKLIADIELHPDADRVLFASIGEHNRWHVFHMPLDGTAPQALPLINEPDVDNYDPCFLPDGNILFASTSTFTGVPCVQGSSHVANLHRFVPASGEIRRLTFDQEHNWNPTVIHDGRVIYQRWEYSDLPHSNSRILFQMNPDGTNQSELYGSNSYFPNSFFYARPIPGHPSKIIGIATGHHGVARAGRLLILDPAISRTEAEGVVHEFPHRGRKVEAIVKDQLVKDVWPQFLMPWPLDENHVIVSCKPTPQSLWGIYLVDTFDNMTLIHESPGNNLLEPIALQKRPTAPVIPDRTDPERADATVLLTDIYQGPGLEGLPHGTVKQLRVIEYYFSPRGMGGMLGAIGMEGPWDIRRVLGTVPVEPDGSAHFTIPAQTPVFVQPLDAEGQALQTMRSWFTGMPGERVSCVGCHAGMHETPPTAAARAAMRQPSLIDPGWHAPTRGFNFAREVQPVLDRNCTSCHSGEEGHAAPYLKGDRMITDWVSKISGNAKRDGGNFTTSYAELHRYIRRPGIESDMRVLSPMDYHFSTTELGKMLRAGHHGVTLDRESFERIVTWADLNAPFHGTWTEISGNPGVADQIARANELRKRYAPSGPIPDYETIPAANGKACSGGLRPPMPMPGESGAPRVPNDTAVTDTPLQAFHSPKSVPPPVIEIKTTELLTKSLDLGGGVAMEFIKVPGGRFNGKDIAPFWIGKTEVTNAQLRRYLTTHDSRDESRHGYQFGRRGYDMNADLQPAVRVSWNDARAFARWLGQSHSLTVELPDGLQWEWACRAGSTTAFPFGDLDADYSAHANLGDKTLAEFAACTARQNYHAAEPIQNPNRYDDWIPRDDRFSDATLVTAPVAGFLPNAWGLHDMIGNAAEWTRDTDQNGNPIARGGSWYDRPHLATATTQTTYAPHQRVFNTGFRIVLIEGE